MSDLAGIAPDFARLAGLLITLYVVVSFLVRIGQRAAGPERVTRWLGGSPAMGVLKGSAFGAATPFCSCSTIPVLAGLLKAGVPFATASAFLISSPLLDPVLFGVMLVVFGASLTAGYVIVATVGTFAIAAAFQLLSLDRDVRGGVRVVGDSGGEEGPWRGWRVETPPAWRLALSDLRPMLVPMLVGVAVGVAIYGLVPRSLLVTLAGPDNPFAVVVAALLAAPLYLRAEAALPIAYALLEKGVGVGPVFAFVLAGAAISPPEFIMLSKLFRPKLMAALVIAVLVLAVVGGMVISLFS